VLTDLVNNVTSKDDSLDDSSIRLSQRDTLKTNEFPSIASDLGDAIPKDVSIPGLSDALDIVDPIPASI